MFFIRLVEDGGLCGHPEIGSAALAWHTEAEAVEYRRVFFNEVDYTIVKYAEVASVVN